MVSKSAPIGVVVAVVTLLPQSTLRFRLAVQVSARFWAPAQGVLGVFAVLVEL